MGFLPPRDTLVFVFVCPSRIRLEQLGSEELLTTFASCALNHGIHGTRGGSRRPNAPFLETCTAMGTRSQSVKASLTHVGCFTMSRVVLMHLQSAAFSLLKRFRE
jgi:hypothetical protein